jgi:hypothetical protein
MWQSGCFWPASYDCSTVVFRPVVQSRVLLQLELNDFCVTSQEREGSEQNSVTSGKLANTYLKKALNGVSYTADTARKAPWSGRSTLWTMG